MLTFYAVVNVYFGETTRTNHLVKLEALSLVEADTQLATLCEETAMLDPQITKCLVDYLDYKSPCNRDARYFFTPETFKNDFMPTALPA